MPVLTVYQGFQKTQLQVETGASVSRVLQDAGILTPQPCGGRGVCGKCAALMEGELSERTQAEIRLGTRLVCQTTLQGDAALTIPQRQSLEQIETGCMSVITPCEPIGRGYGAAVDIRTTTLALRLYDLSTGQCMGVSSMANPQAAVAADVIGRIGAALDGRLDKLNDMVSQAVAALTAQAAAQAEISPADVQTMVITGNTTMLYLFSCRNPSSLSRAPFEADCLFDEMRDWQGKTAYLPPCLHAFVGADIACAVLASRMCEKNETALLCDIGTNGEIALWKDGVLYIASTAAGPAFEGAGISCGCGSIPGAIDRVTVRDGALQCATIQGERAVGLCGSGLVDAVAALLEIGLLDETGALEEAAIELRDGVCLTQADIRAVQLAKSAIAAGIECLLNAADVTQQQISRLYLAGGFGTHLNLSNAVRIGLLPENLAKRTQVIGNAALDGAAQTLLKGESIRKMRIIAQKTNHVNLGGNALFNERYVENMFFPEE